MRRIGKTLGDLAYFEPAPKPKSWPSRPSPAQLISVRQEFYACYGYHSAEYLEE